MARKRTVARKSLDQQRPVVTAITLKVLYLDGSTRTVTYDPRETEALFWSDWAVTEILGRYYDKHHPKMTRTELERRFGKARVDRLRPGDELELTRQDIIDLWNSPDESGIAVGVMRKDIHTTPSP